jgi:tetratricopeptide (TPR) repeat protein
VLSSTTYLDCADLGGGSLFQCLAAALLDADLDNAPLFDGESAASLGQRLAQDAAAVATGLAQRSGSKPRVAVFVDRLEAIFRSPAAERTAFVAVLETLARSGGMLVVMACRNDFYPDIVALPALMALKARGGHYDLTAPDGADIAQIVRQPARAAKLTFEHDASSGASLDDVLCDAARGSPDTLPLLQYCLNELYRLRSDDGQLRFDAFHELGGIEGAIGVRAEQVVATLKPEQVAALPHVLSLLVNIGDEQAAVTARRSPWSLLRNDAERELVRAMVEARLFVSELAGDVPSFGVAHEALLRRWPRVADWIERYRHALQLRTRLSGQAARWAASGRDRDLLIPRGSQVSQAAELLTLEDFSLAPLEAEYVRASIQRARLGERIRNTVVALIALLAILATALGLMARSAQRDAEHQRSEAENLMTFMLTDFVDKLRPIGRLELLDDVSSRAMAYLAGADSGSSVGAPVQRAQALNVIGEVNVVRGNTKAAAEALDASRSLLKKLESEQKPASASAYKAMGMNAFLLGQMHGFRNEWSNAARYMEEYRQYSKLYVQVDPQNVDAWIEQSYAENSLGSMAMKLRDYDVAAQAFGTSLQLKLRAQEKRPNDEKLKGDLANSYSWLAESKVKLGRLDDAMALNQEEASILRPIHSKNSAWTNRLALSLWRQGILNSARGQTKDAVANLQSAVALFEKLVTLEPESRQWQTRLYMARLRLIETQHDQGNSADKLDQLQEIYSKMKALGEKEPNNGKLSAQIAKLQQAQVPLLVALKRQGEALQLLDTALSSFERLYRANLRDETLIAYYVEALLERGEMQGIESSEYCGKAAHMLEPFLAGASDYSMLALDVRARICQGNFQSTLASQEKLAQMSYRDPLYLKSVSSHTTKKGKP